MKAPKIYYLALAAFSIMILFIGMAHAADMTQPAAHTPGVHNHGFPGMNVTNATVQQHILTGLKTKGIDVSAAKTFLEKGDTASVSAWLATYFESNKSGRMNGTARFNLSAGRPFSGEKGGNVSATRTAYHGTMTAGANWTGTRMPPHGGGMAGNATRFNATAIISDLGKKGVDVSAAGTALRKGDSTAVTAWLGSYFQAHRNEEASHDTPWGHRNSTLSQRGRS